jgi:hypothetical protein
LKNSKLFKLLRKLNVEEMANFKNFVSSAYFNDVCELHKFLELIVRENYLSKEVVDADEIMKFLNPGPSKIGRRLQDLMHGLVRMLEEFLAQEKYRNDAFQRKINLMLVAYEKELVPVIKDIERDVEVLHATNSVRDSNYFYESFMMYSARDYGFRMLGKITDNDSLQKKSDQLDLFYMALKLKDSCEMLNRSKIISSQYQFTMLEPVINYIKDHPELYSGYPAIDIYFNIYLMFTGEEHENNFFTVMKLLQENRNVFSDDELRSLYTYAQNYCIRRINQGNTDFTRHLFHLYTEILNTGLVFGDNKNIQWDFKNYVSLGLRLKEYEWTWTMIIAFKDRLPGNVKQNAYNYNLANYYYETGEFKKAIRLLNSVEFNDIYYNLDSRVMLLKIYYKLEEEESFFSLVSSFGMNLKRNKLLSKETAEIYNNLLRFTKKAFQFKTMLPYQRKKEYRIKVEALNQKIIQTQKVANINWLLQEVGELLNVPEK